MSGNSGEGLPIDTAVQAVVRAHGGKRPHSMGNEFRKTRAIFVIAPLSPPQRGGRAE